MKSNEAKPPNDLIDTCKAGRLACTHASTIRRWILAGKVRGWRRFDRWMVSRAEILGVWKRHEVKGGASSLPASRADLDAAAAYDQRLAEEAGLRPKRG